MTAAAGGGDLKKAIRKNRSIFRRHWAALSRMPEFSHWPDRSEPFDPARSEVVGYVLRECLTEAGRLSEAEIFERAIRIIHAANKTGVIRFDQKTKLWSGMAPPWQGYRERSEIAAARERYHREARQRATRIRICELCGEWFDDDRVFLDHCAGHRPFHPDFDPNRMPELR